MQIRAVGRLSAGLASPEGPHFSPTLQSGLGKIRMCTSRLSEALWPTERLALLSVGHLQLPRCLQNNLPIVQVASLVLHVRRYSSCNTTALSKQHGLTVQLETLLTLCRDLTRP